MAEADNNDALDIVHDAPIIDERTNVLALKFMCNKK
jgi:hypothetical protein